MLRFVSLILVLVLACTVKAQVGTQCVTTGPNNCRGCCKAKFDAGTMQNDQSCLTPECSPFLTQGSPVPVAEAVAPVAEAVAPVAEAVAPVAEAVDPVAEAVAAAAEAVAPVVEAVAPVADAAAPVVEAISVPPVPVDTVATDGVMGKCVGLAVLSIILMAMI
jgi:hypothetical protein